MNYLLCLLALVVPASTLLGVGRTQSTARLGTKGSGRLMQTAKERSQTIASTGLRLGLKAIGSFGSVQSIAVKGKLLCNGQPAANVKVKLYEKETTIDKKLDEETTNQNGEFRLQGSKTEISTIDPKLNIYHKCNYNDRCYKKIGITIPDNYVTSGANPTQVFDVGTLNLANQSIKQTTDCLN